MHAQELQNLLRLKKRPCERPADNKSLPCLQVFLNTTKHVSNTHRPLVGQTDSPAP